MGQATRTYVGLDIGTTKISCIIADMNGTRRAARGRASATRPSEGLRRGVVVDLEKTVASIQRAVDEAERMAGVPVKGVYAGIAGDHIRSINSRGVIAVSRKDNEIGAGRRRPRGRGRQGDRHPDGPRDHPRHPAGVHRRRPGRHQGPGRHERRAARGRGPHHHRRGDVGQEHLPRRSSAPGSRSTTWCSSRWPRATPCWATTSATSAWCCSTSAAAPPTSRCSSRARSATPRSSRSAART